MTIKFYGTFKELSSIIKNSEYLGAWKKPAQRTKRVFTFNNGVLLNYWPSTGSINFQGKNEVKEEVQAALALMLFKKL